MHPARSKTIVRFGTYEVSFESGELRKAGIRIKIQQQPLKVLELLLERPGEVVTREELRGRIWPKDGLGEFDQALNIAMGKLRVALGDSAENPRFIETLPKRGYRFLAEVTVVGPTSPEIASSPVIAAEETGASSPRSARSAALIGLALL